MKNQTEREYEAQLVSAHEEHLASSALVGGFISGRLALAEKLVRALLVVLIADIGYGAWLTLQGIYIAMLGGKYSYHTHDELGNPIVLELTREWWRLRKLEDFKVAYFSYFNL